MGTRRNITRWDLLRIPSTSLKHSGSKRRNMRACVSCTEPDSVREQHEQAHFLGYEYDPEYYLIHQ